MTYMLRSLGGPDEDWNMIPLSYIDHFIAHQLRFEVYNEFVDKLFLRMRTGQTLEAHKDAVKASHASQKFNQTGFWNCF
jgi:hypothetical protein